MGARSFQSNSNHSSRSIGDYPAPLFYLAFVLLLAGALAPLFHLAIEPWTHIPFSRYVNRALMVAALLGLIPYFRRHWRTLGIHWQSRSRRDTALGLAISLGSVLVILGIHLGLGSRVWTGPLSWNLLGGAVLAATLVSPLEEILFRGAAQQALTARLGTVAGVITGAAFFAVVHFIKVPKSYQPDPVTWQSGFHSLQLALQPLAQSTTYGSALGCLFVVGLILGLTFHRTGSLWLPIGLHAGWIIGLKLFSALTAPAPHAPAWLGGADLLSGDLTLIILALLGCILAKWAR